MITVALVDDHPIIHAGFQQVLAADPELRLVAAAERIEKLPPMSPLPDVLLLDLHLPGRLQGVVGVRVMRDRGHRILVVTGEDTSAEDVADALAAGATGYLSKDADTGEYLKAIRAVHDGRTHVGARLAALARRDNNRLGADDPNRLTEREAEVAGLIVEGYTNAEIASLLTVSERTIDGHVENLKQKLCESRRVRVAMRLKELGYEPPEARRWPTI
jgi:NarL family two-component system response regulator LiaR